MLLWTTINTAGVKLRPEDWLQIFQRWTELTLCDGNSKNEAQTRRPAAATILKWPQVQERKADTKTGAFTLQSQFTHSITASDTGTTNSPPPRPICDDITMHCQYSNCQCWTLIKFPQRKTGGCQQIPLTWPVSPVFLLSFKTSPELTKSL